MPRRPRTGTGGLVFHVLNRAVQGITLFEDSQNYARLLQILAATMRRVPIRLLAYTVMPNHWHLVLWPDCDQSLPLFMKWLTATHAQEWRRVNGTAGRGAVYQGRYKAIAVQQDAHFLRLCRYVERNAVRAKLVTAAADWQWSSAAGRPPGPDRPEVTAWPIPRPADWTERLDVPEAPAVLGRLRSALRTGRHYGTQSWRFRTAEQLAWRGGARGPGRVWEVETRDTDAGRPDSRPVTIL